MDSDQEIWVDVLRYVFTTKQLVVMYYKYL